MLTGIGGATFMPRSLFAQATGVDPATMPRIGTVDERHGSYNVEMIEVTGGRFWKPYGKAVNAMINPALSLLAPIEP